MTPRQRPLTLDVHPSYKGGHTLQLRQYIWEFRPQHPACNMWGWVLQHRLVAEDTCGRPLLPTEMCHHIDGNPLNNSPDNLAVVTASEHMRIHRAQSRERYRAPLTEDAVREALEQGGLKHAARVLGVHTQTLRNRFPDLVAPHKRKSPTNIDDPQIVETIRRLAPDPTVGYRQIAEHYGIAAMTVVRLCQRHGIAWVKQTRKGEKRRPYRRRGPSPT